MFPHKDKQAYPVVVDWDFVGRKNAFDENMTVPC